MRNHTSRSAGAALAALALLGSPAAVWAQEQTTPPPLSPAAAGVSEDASAEPPAPRKRRPLRIGFDLGVYVPADAEARRLFGDRWTTFSIGIGGLQRTREGGELRADSNLVFQNHNGNRILLAPFGLEYRVPFGAPGGPRPYAGVGGNALVTEMRAESAGVRRGWRVGAGASLFGGVEFRDRGFLEVRYRAASDIRGIGLSGTNVTAGFRF